MNPNEYTGLNYKTRGNASPQGKPRVYFCCHQDDFDMLFEETADDILNIQRNAAIWYYDPAEGIPDGDDFWNDLSQMQLFVIRVTVKYVYHDNHARDEEFKFAVEHHIPVLPILNEQGIEEDFNKVCGDLQVIFRYDPDPTATPYEDRLKKYLEAVLVSDELTEKIRAAFDAYIFLSYRKKDRKYAQQIMRLIHENDFCRDIAIWYDEFLMPGEHYNQAIADAIAKSSLFVLVVTPNLLEKPNYVMTKEYPAALDAKKPILPIEAVDTDKEALNNMFDGIHPPMSTDNAYSVSEGLTKALHVIILRENDDEPIHNYFIGLAYLSGIDVEINHARALELIIKAAENGIFEAYEKLVVMYNTGEGVKRNYNMAIEWQKKYIVLLENQTKQTQSQELLSKLFFELQNLYNSLYSVYATRDVATVEDIAKKMLDTASMLDKALQAEVSGYDCIAYESLGKIYIEMERIGDAAECYRKELEACKSICKIDKSSKALDYLAHAYFQMGNLSKKMFTKDAEVFLEGAIDIQKSLVKERGTINDKRNLAISCMSLAEFLNSHDKTRDAIKYYQEAYEIFASIADETDMVESYMDLAKAFYKLGDISHALSHLEDAFEYYQRGLDISKKLNHKYARFDIKRNCIVGYSYMGKITESLGRLEDARIYYSFALERAKELADVTHSISIQFDLAICYFKMGRIYYAIRKTETSLKYYQESVRIFELIFREDGFTEARYTLATSYYNMGIVLSTLNRKTEALDFYEKAADVCKALVQDTRNAAYIYLKEETELALKSAKEEIQKETASETIPQPLLEGYKEALPDDGKSWYKGWWKNGLRDGFGEASFPGGGGYRGEWKEGKPNGYGVKIDIFGKKICGIFEKGYLKRKLPQVVIELKLRKWM